LAKTALFEPHPSLEDSARLDYSWELDFPVFTSLDFATIFLYQLMSQLYPQASGSLLVTFDNSQGNIGGILTSLHMKFRTA
jgi:hypothetical protein